MPTMDTKTQHMTVRHSPDTPGHLEVTIRHNSDGHPAQLLRLGAPGQVMTRRELDPVIETVQLRLDRGDAMILLSMLEEVAYDLPMPDHAITVGREE